MENDRLTPHARRIRDFMERAGQDIPDYPTARVPDKTLLLRAQLIMEEALETIQALGVDIETHHPGVCRDDLPLTQGCLRFIRNKHRDPDLIEIADGCADVSVVTIGTLLALGIHDDPLLNEVDKSNLAKFGEGGYRDTNGKWQKPPGWKKPEISTVLQQQLTPSGISYKPEDVAECLHCHERIRVVGVMDDLTVVWDHFPAASPLRPHHYDHVPTPIAFDGT